MKMMLSIPRTISITVRLIRLTSPSGRNSTLRCDTARALSLSLAQLCPRRLATCAASSTARATTERMRPSSRISKPAMVQPAGVVT